MGGLGFEVLISKNCHCGLSCLTITNNFVDRERKILTKVWILVKCG